VRIPRARGITPSNCSTQNEGTQDLLIEIREKPKYKSANRAERDNVGEQRRLPEERDYKTAKNRGGVL
jgi:hypothetical protein